MTLVGFLNPVFSEYITTALSGFHVRLANSWGDLLTLMGENEPSAVILDPAADGAMHLDAVFGVLEQHPLLPVFAYLALHPANLRTVLDLSRSGLAGVFVHPLRLSRSRFMSAIESASANRLALGLLGLMEARLSRLLPDLSGAVEDLFQHPSRYSSASDLAVQSGIPIRQVYRDFSRAGLGSPARLVTVAKVLRAYWYLRVTHESLTDASGKLGYAFPRALSERMKEVFGCQPSRLRDDLPPQEILMQCAEWLSKPASRS